MSGETDAKSNQINDALLTQAAARALEAEVSIRKYFETLIFDVRRTLEHESHDREMTATALREENRNALRVAEQEREKAAAALRFELQRTMTDGDERLREHIQAAVEQLEAALISAEKLEVERVSVALTRVESLRQMIAISDEAQKEAISKAEAANERRFASVNEFREQLNDQAQTFLPRAEFSVQHEAIGERVTKNEQAVTLLREQVVSKASGDTVRLDTSTEWRHQQNWSTGTILATVLGVASLIVAVVVMLFLLSGGKSTSSTTSPFQIVLPTASANPTH